MQKIFVNVSQIGKSPVMFTGTQICVSVDFTNTVLAKKQQIYVYQRLILKVILSKLSKTNRSGTLALNIFWVQIFKN